MLQRIKDRLHREDKGFTLIELMVVVLIIAILIAIAIPTFLGARTRAQDRAAQSSLRNAVTAAKALYTDSETYVSATVAALVASEPSLTFKASNANSTSSTDVSIDNSAATSFRGAVLSASGTCWYIRDAVDVAASPGTGWVKKANAGAACNADESDTTPGANWARSPANAGALA